MSQDENRAQQVALYGAPLAELVGGVTATLKLSQAKVATLIGVSAPMLSQLVSAHRVKLGNPVAVARLHTLIELAGQVRAGALTVEAALAHAGRQEQGQVLTRTTHVAPRHPAGDVQQLMRSVASATDLLEAATLIAQTHPGIAELLRVYGAGRTDEAEAHYARHVGRV